VIPFNRPGLLDGGLDRVREVLASRRLAGNGPVSLRVEELLQSLLCVPRVLLMSSCTHALELAGLLLDLGPGDEVIVPAFTFVSTVNAFVLRGARPVFADVRPDTLCIDETNLDALVTPRTRAIVPVHYAGVACEMDAINEIARRANAAVIEDNAHGLFGTYRGRSLGTLGALATQSFHETKNFTCGEGGALVINDDRFIERALVMREKGTNRSRFFRGEVDKYTWVDLGSSYLLPDILSALLLDQLERRDQIQAARMRIWQRYAVELADWASAQDVRLPVVPAYCEQPAHLFYLLIAAPRRAALIEHLRHRGVHAVWHYQPLNLSPMGRAHGGVPGSCPVTERVADELLRLPLYADLSEAEQTTVIEAVRAFG
jgi:dTDP-4-amino-4,6-dideoxygalactose transaminase